MDFQREREERATRRVERAISEAGEAGKLAENCPGAYADFCGYRKLRLDDADSMRAFAKAYPKGNYPCEQP